MSEADTPPTPPAAAVQLGFCIPIESDEQRLLVGHQPTSSWKDWDGGQAGGRPTWLDPDHVPAGAPTCGSCERSMRFVGQIYAPRDNDIFNFHRTLYIWACGEGSGSSCQNNVVVWRCQLPEDNAYWTTATTEAEAAVSNAQRERASSWCTVCNFPSKGVCPKQQLPFCGKDHQRQCLKRQGTIQYKVHEIVVEEAPEQPLPSSQSDADTMLEHAAVLQDEPDSDAELEQEDLNEALTGRRSKPQHRMSPEDECAWDRFHATIQQSRDQVLRYGETEPLWMRAAPTDVVIPDCETCGAQRTFEFQLMPQILPFLTEDDDDDINTNETKSASLVSAIAAVDDLIQQAPTETVPPELVERKDAAIKNIETSGLDWGVVAIYTCSNSCEISGYACEFAYVQSAFADATTEGADSA